MKKVLGLTGVAAAILLGGYYGMGVVTERTVKNTLGVVNKSSNGIRVDVESYNRGWFSSAAQLKWHFAVPEQVVNNNGQSHTIPAQKFDFDMPLTINHGPIIFSANGVKLGMGYAHTDINMPQKMVGQFNELFTKESTQPKLDLSLLVSYFNHSKVNMGVPSFMLKAKEGNVEFDWSGMLATTNLSSSLSNISGSINLDGLKVIKDKIVTTLEPVSAGFDLHKSINGLYIGDANFSFPSLVVKDNDKIMVSVNKFDTNSSTDVDDDLFSLSVEMSLDKVVAEGKNYGPGHIEMAVRNLDAETVASINDIAHKAQGATDVERQQAMLAILPQLPKLLSKGPEIEISDIHLVLPEGAIDGHMTTSLPASPDNANPLKLMQNLHGEGKFSIPGAVLKTALTESIKQKMLSQAGAPGVNVPTNPTDLDSQVATKVSSQMSAMVQSGLMVKTGENYGVEFKLEKGQFTVNGKPFNPAMVQF